MKVAAVRAEATKTATRRGERERSPAPKGGANPPREPLAESDSSGGLDRARAKAGTGSASSTDVGLRLATKAFHSQLCSRQAELRRKLSEAQAAREADVREIEEGLKSVKTQLKELAQLGRERKSSTKSARLLADLRNGMNSRLAKSRKNVQRSEARAKE